MSRYAKTLVALIPVILAGLYVLTDALGDGNVTAVEWIAVTVAVLTAAGVYAVPNRPPAGEASDPNVSEQRRIEEVPYRARVADDGRRDLGL